MVKKSAGTASAKAKKSTAAKTSVQKKLKTFSFGTSAFAKTSPKLDALSPSTKVLNLTLSFEEALKLNLALDECVRKLNAYNRNTTAGRRSALNIAIHLDQSRISVNEGKL